MSRKTSTYARKRRAHTARRADPHSVYRVLNRTEPLREEERAQLLVPVRLSFEKMRSGTGTEHDFDTLAATVNLCMVVAETVSSDMLHFTQQAQDALMDMHARHKRTGRWGLDHASLELLPSVIHIYEQLLELCAPAQLKRAWIEVVDRVNTKNTMPESWK